MIFDKEGNTTLVYQENVSLEKFLEGLKTTYPKLVNDNIIVNLFSFSKLTSDHVLEFLGMSNTHREGGRSFVIVTDKLAYNEIPDDICVVPTLQEARDIIEMEEIERDLGL